MTTLRISAWIGHQFRTVDDIVGSVRAAADAGFEGAWVPQTLTLDTLTALAVAGREVPDIPIGSAVVPIQGRHPITMAQQALALADAVGAARVSVGLGVTHALVPGHFYGVPYRGVVGLCEEFLEALSGLLGPTHTADHAGERITARATVAPAGPSPALLLAALGPRMLDVAGRLADGTITWMTGPGLLERVVVPGITAAAERAGRPAPRIVAGLPICVTDDPEAAKDLVRPRIVGASNYASYGRQLAAEGLDDLADLALIGTADAVEAHLAHLEAIGVTELMADVDGTPDEQAATREFLRARIARA